MHSMLHVNPALQRPLYDSVQSPPLNTLTPLNLLPPVQLSLSRVDEALKIFHSEQKVTNEKCCEQCGRTATQLKTDGKRVRWRKGPSGPSSLCDACGGKWYRMNRKLLTNHEECPDAGADADTAQTSGDESPRPREKAGNSATKFVPLSALVTVERKCEFCGKAESELTTPKKKQHVWRLGPSGPKTLCEKCGAKWYREKDRPGNRPAALLQNNDARTFVDSSGHLLTSIPDIATTQKILDAIEKISMKTVPDGNRRRSAILEPAHQFSKQYMTELLSVHEMLCPFRIRGQNFKNAMESVLNSFMDKSKKVVMKRKRLDFDNDHGGDNNEDHNDNDEIDDHENVQEGVAQDGTCARTRPVRRSQNASTQHRFVAPRFDFLRFGNLQRHGHNTNLNAIVIVFLRFSIA